jgi:hypothetical protein
MSAQASHTEIIDLGVGQSLLAVSVLISLACGMRGTGDWQARHVEGEEGSGIGNPHVDPDGGLERNAPTQIRGWGPVGTRTRTRTCHVLIRSKGSNFQST